MRQSKLKILHLDLLALSSSLEFLAPLDSWADFIAEVSYRTRIAGEVLENVEKEKSK